MLKFIDIPSEGIDKSVVINTDLIRDAKLTREYVLITLIGEYPPKVNEKTGKIFTDGEIWLPKDKRILEFLVSKEAILQL